jgi:syntaxin 1B/2/3
MINLLPSSSSNNNTNTNNNDNPDQTNNGDTTDTESPSQPNRKMSTSDNNKKSGDQFMDRFFADVERAKGAITRVKGATSKIKELQDEAMTAIGNKEQEVSESLARVLTQANKDCAFAKRILEGLKKETETLDRKKLHAEIRIRENVHATVLQNLVVAVRGYQSAQQEYKAKLRNKAATAVRIAEPTATDEQIDVVIRNGDVNSVYRQKMLQPGSDVVAQAYLHAMDKYQDVLKLERSVEELHKMFMDLAVLVEAQGQMLSNIETKVYTARDYVESGNKQLNQALKAQKATRRRMCCFIVCLIVVLGLILGPVMGILGNGGSFLGRRRLILDNNNVVDDGNIFSTYLNNQYERIDHHNNKELMLSIGYGVV